MPEKISSMLTANEHLQNAQERINPHITAILYHKGDYSAFKTFLARGSVLLTVAQDEQITCAIEAGDTEVARKVIVDVLISEFGEWEYP